MAIFKNAGLDVRRYRYYNPETVALDFEGTVLYILSNTISNVISLRVLEIQISRNVISLRVLEIQISIISSRLNMT